MAARTVKIRHDDETRAKIQVSQIINRLQNHVLGKIELTNSQVRSADILLAKRLPDLTQADVKHEITPSDAFIQLMRRVSAGEFSKPVEGKVIEHQATDDPA